jgi:hypothetical protein
MARIKWGPKKCDGHVNKAAKRRRMKRAHETKTRQAAKKALRRELSQ